MALKASIFKAELTVSDMDRHYYNTHSLTLARHPSETNERMMLRLTAFAFYADNTLRFGRGISTDDEPDLWQHAPNGDITHWIDLGLPSLERLRKACSRAQQVSLWAYGSDRSFQPWWQKIEAELQRFEQLHIVRIDPQTSQTLATMATANMPVQAMIQDGELWFSIDDSSVAIKPATVKPTTQTS